MPNRLANETSPYLLQHKDNPVDWYPWGPEALERAKAEDKPILVSIGYSACHWCHVMEHESFSDPGIARLMNDNFVCIKVDREERPDLDQIYMSAVQAMTGHGGWPLNVFLTPEGVPFFGGTYWPPVDRHGMPSFRRVLDAVADTYRNRRADVQENAERLREYLTQLSQATPETTGNLSAERLDHAVRVLESQFDVAHGGFGQAPKFPQPQVLDFLLRCVRRTGDARARTMVQVTLDHMAAGGMYDQIGGGFHRYSVDERWLVPHFEKMLYDNAQLARIYLDAARAFGRDDYRRVAEETLDYVVREMTAPEGGFYSAQDADSEGEEGKFYTWTPAEIEAVLGPDQAQAVMEYYGVTPGGNFEGRSILYRRLPAEEAVEAAATDQDITELEREIAEARAKLLEARARRVWPARDDKVITAWNGMMLRAMAEGALALGRSDLLSVAERNGRFILDRLVSDGQVARTWKEGRTKGSGYLEDYANAADGLLALYQATFDRRWVDAAIRLVDEALTRFSGESDGLLYDASHEQTDLVVRPRELQDGATPSGNSVIADVCLRLWGLTGNERYLQQAEQTLRLLADAMVEVPLGFGRILGVAANYVGGLREVTFAGDRTAPEFAAMRRVVDVRYEPNAVLAWYDPDDPDLVEVLPILQGRAARDGQPTAYVCEHQTCLPPVTTPAELTRALDLGVRGWTSGESE